MGAARRGGPRRTISYMRLERRLGHRVPGLRGVGVRLMGTDLSTIRVDLD